MGVSNEPLWGVVRHPDFYYDFTTNEGSDLPYFASFWKKCRIRKENKKAGKVGKVPYNGAYFGIPWQTNNTFTTVILRMTE